MKWHPDEQEAMVRLADRLGRRFEHVAAETVRAVVEEVWAGFIDCRIRDYLPILVERAAGDRLRSLTDRAAAQQVREDYAGAS